MIEAYSPFVIRPQKGHENANYSAGLMQVCFLTETAARALNAYRDLKERILNRKLQPSEYIFTHQKDHLGMKHLAPITTPTVEFFFQEASTRSGKRISPHLLRSWVNSVLASRGIDKQLRDIYLGHTCWYEMGYVMQLIPQWQQTFKQAQAMEHLDIMANAVTSADLEMKLQRVEQQQKEIERLKQQLNMAIMSDVELETLKKLLRAIQEKRFKLE